MGATTECAAMHPDSTPQTDRVQSHAVKRERPCMSFLILKREGSERRKIWGNTCRGRSGIEPVDPSSLRLQLYWPCAGPAPHVHVAARNIPVMQQAWYTKISPALNRIGLPQKGENLWMSPQFRRRSIQATHSCRSSSLAGCSRCRALVRYFWK